MQTSSILIGINIDVGGSDLLGATNFELTHQISGWTGQGTARSILLQAGTRVGDVQVTHGQLTDTVVWTKGCVGNAFHGQFFWGVRQVVTGGIQDGVVVTAAQAQGDFTGDG